MDKLGPMAKHASWAIDDYDKDPWKMKARMLNVVQNHTGIH